MDRPPPTLPVTRFTTLVGCRLPIQQAGMGAVSTVALAAAVARAGGLGMLGAAGLTTSDLADQLTAASAATGPGDRIGINFLIPFLDVSAFEAAAASTSVVECFYGDPDPSLVARAHEAGALMAWQVGSQDEALAAEAAGCDFLVIQGAEAGGHVRGITPLLPLLASVRDRMELPLVAAGGIGSGRALAEVLAAGADAARVGTRLLATSEADAHPAYVQALINADGDDTVVSEAFSLGWPGAPHRVLRACVEASDRDPSTRSPLPPTRSFSGVVASAALYAGTSVSDVSRVQPATQVIRELVADAAAALATDPAPGPIDLLAWDDTTTNP